jgi:hypothetical protein
VRELIVVCSVHRERGSCNAGTLLHLLQHLAPSIIFAESKPAELALPQSVEGGALRAYVAHHQCRVVPVDDVEVPPDHLATLAAELAPVFRYVEQASDDYRALKDLGDHDSFMYGFEYLNSRAFAALNARLEGIEDQVIGQSLNEPLIRALKEWRLLHELREQGMVSNIYRYSREMAFDRGVFLVGAAHKHGVLKKAALAAVADAVPIAWIGLENQTAEPLPPEAASQLGAAADKRES